jgi:ATP-dependent RNA helicase SUPV3L1/SUV3
MRVYVSCFFLSVSHRVLSFHRTKVESVDLRYPWQWYPIARALERRLIYHAGPTNSGKTHNALQAFKSAGSGLYCGPLRLLAMEVYDRMNAEGTYCNLVTGVVSWKPHGTPMLAWYV